MEKDGAAISPSAAILAVVVTFLFVLFLGAVFYILNVEQSLVLILGELGIAVVPFCVMVGKRVNIGKYIGSKIGPKIVVVGIALGALLLFLDIFLSAGLVTLFGGETQAMKDSAQQVQAISKSTLGLVSLVIALSMSGICEEFTFRGFLLTAINSKYSFGVSLVVSSLAFGLFHFDPQGVYIIWAFLMGLALGFIYHHWHSYAVSAIAHATLDLLVLAITFIQH
jgi:membrane protease YdiL (CAAX protease family)